MDAAIATGRTIPAEYIGWAAAYCAAYVAASILLGFILFEDSGEASDKAEVFGHHAFWGSDDKDELDRRLALALEINALGASADGHNHVGKLVNPGMGECDFVVHQCGIAAFAGEDFIVEFFEVEDSGVIQEQFGDFPDGGTFAGGDQVQLDRFGLEKASDFHGTTGVWGQVQPPGIVLVSVQGTLSNRLFRDFNSEKTYPPPQKIQQHPANLFAVLGRLLFQLGPGRLPGEEKDTSDSSESRPEL